MYFSFFLGGLGGLLADAHTLHTHAGSPHIWGFEPMTFSMEPLLSTIRADARGRFDIVKVSIKWLSFDPSVTDICYASVNKPQKFGGWLDSDGKKIVYYQNIFVSIFCQVEFILAVHYFAM